MTQFKTLIIFFASVLLFSCSKEEQDYRYVITNKTSMTEPVTINYTVEGDNKVVEKELYPNDSMVLADRLDIRGKKIWDVESSVGLYKIKTLHAYSHDESQISEELAFRKLWRGPADANGIGIYQIDLTDSLFVLKKQAGYTYCIKNELRDTVFSTSHLKLISGENTTRSADTILKGECQSIGSVDIYTYGEEFAGEQKYKTQKLSGLSSIFFIYKNNRVTINKSKDTAYFVISQDTCTLVVSESMNIKKN